MLCGDFGLPAPFQSSLWWLLCSCDSFSEKAWSSIQPGLVCQPWKLQDAHAEPWQLVSAHCHGHSQGRVLQALGGWPPPPFSGQPFHWVPWNAALEATWLPSGCHLGCHSLGTAYHLPPFSVLEPHWLSCKKNHSGLAGLTLNCWSQTSTSSPCPRNDFLAFSFMVKFPTPPFSRLLLGYIIEKIETVKGVPSLSFLLK